MSTLAERIRDVSDLSEREAEWLRLLCSSWQVLADLSFSDLLLYVPSKNHDEYEIVAQLRPFTSQTLYPQDMVRMKVTQPEQPIVERAYREGRIWAQSDPVLVDGIPIRMDAVPVRFEGTVIAVVTKEGSPATSRRPGRLEQVYLDAAEHFSRMIAEGKYPYEGMTMGDWPRVGDGLFRFDAEGKVSWASPNALSSMRRLGVRQNVLGRHLSELGLGPTPVADAMQTRRMVDGELAYGDNHVMLRVLPLLGDDDAFGAIGLARDVSEIRQRDRVISGKDAMIREIHHRVKNNLQTIASLLRLQGRRLQSEEAKAALQESVLRIGSIALVHETLSEQPADVAEFGEVARRIGHMVADGLLSPERGVEIKVVGSTGPLAAEVATPLAVTLTELIQNAIEHAFPDGQGGTIAVELSRSDSIVSVVVADDGVGISPDALEGARLGLQIVRTLILELGGRFDIGVDNGTRVELEVPISR
ncbi:MAG TPA: histidine kinase N-terminal domain-containing protein [Actinomycetota bacterium]|nr:histidine kinase N-terminal domain-containing protein [Actinomycetota bacterium]